MLDFKATYKMAEIKKKYDCYDLISDLYTNRF